MNKAYIRKLSLWPDLLNTSFGRCRRTCPISCQPSGWGEGAAATLLHPRKMTRSTEIPEAMGKPQPEGSCSLTVSSFPIHCFWKEANFFEVTVTSLFTRITRPSLYGLLKTLSPNFLRPRFFLRFLVWYCQHETQSIPLCFLQCCILLVSSLTLHKSLIALL